MLKKNNFSKLLLNNSKIDISDLKKNGISFKDGKLQGSSIKKKKYKNDFCVIDGIKFDSKKEANHYAKLLLLKKNKEIFDFDIQHKLDIAINGIHIAYYIVDFVVINNDKTKDYFDVKAKDIQTGKWITTSTFQLKKKLVEAIYSIKIKLI